MCFDVVVCYSATMLATKGLLLSVLLTLSNVEVSIEALSLEAELLVAVFIKSLSNEAMPDGVVSSYTVVELLSGN